MKVTVQLFAAIKEQAGTHQLVEHFESPPTVVQLRERLIERLPQQKELLKRSSMAAEDEFLPDQQVLFDGMVLACIPPVSGG